MSEYETISFDASPAGVVAIILKQPRLTFRMMEELSDVLETVRVEDHTRMVVVRGADGSFCDGVDPHWVELSLDYTRGQNEEEGFISAEVYRRLKDLPQMTVALVDGNAIGGGAGLVAACDLVIAMKSASFSFPEVNHGRIPAIIATYVVEAIGPRWAKALFITGETFDADYAEKLGLVQYTVKDEQEMDSMLEYISQLAFSSAPGAITDIKKLVSDVEGREINKDLSHFSAKLASNRAETAEAKEGAASILESRPPEWNK